MTSEGGANYQSAPFSALPWELMDQKLGGATVLVYAAVYRRGWGEKSTGCWASTKTIADDAQVCHSKAKEALVLLVEHGWIVPIKRPGKTTVYQAQIRPRSDMTQVINDPPPRSDMTQVPRSDMTHEQEPTNKNPLTRETPLTPQRGETPAPKSKRLTPVEKKAQTLISWIDGIPPDFAGRKEQISKWLEARYDNPKNKADLRRPDGFDPWAENALSAKTLRKMIALDGRIADQYLLEAAERGWGSLGHRGAERAMRDIARDLGLAKGPGLANNDRPAPASARTITLADLD